MGTMVKRVKQSKLFKRLPARVQLRIIDPLERFDSRNKSGVDADSYYVFQRYAILRKKLGDGSKFHNYVAMFDIYNLGIRGAGSLNTLAELRKRFSKEAKNFYRVDKNWIKKRFVEKKKELSRRKS